MHEQDLDAPRLRAAGTGSSTARTIAPKTRRGRQLPLSPAVRAQQALALKKQIAPLITGQVEIHVTDNRTVMLSVKRDAKHHRYSARLHHVFVQAPTSILKALARYIEHNEAEASTEIGRFIEDNDDRIAGRRRQSAASIRTVGKVYDLSELFARLNDQYFDGQLKTTITWGRNPTAGRPRSSIRLGSYAVEDNIIRIHPGLDQRWVPAHYIQWVVFHEMLHIVHPMAINKGRRTFHTQAFLEDEKRFESYDAAHNWERRNIAALLSV